MTGVDKSMELAGVVERAMHEFSEAMYHREQLSIRIGRRTTQILRFGMVGLTVLSLIMFYLLHILTSDFARITANMEIMSGHMTNLDQTITRASNDMTDLRQTLSKKLEALPLDQLADNLLAASQSINKLASLPELHQSLDSLNEAMDAVNRILKSPDSRKSVASLSTTLDHVDELVRDLNRQVEPISTDLRATLVQTRNTMARADGTLNATQQLVGDEKLLYSIDTALAEITSAARAVRDLTDLLERQPQVLLRGRDTAAGEPGREPGAPYRE